MDSPADMPRLHQGNLQNQLTVNLTNRLSIRLYSDSRPRCLETAPLHKGLVLMIDKREIVEEGMGFGVPVVKYQDKTYFSSTAEVKILDKQSVFSVQKIFVLDAISRKRFLRSAYINDGVYSNAHEKFEKLYLKYKTFLPLFNSIMELRNLAKIETEFHKVKPRGKISVTYEFQPSAIKIKVDFSDLELEGCEEILVLNEQGSTIFDSYADSNGLRIAGNKIGGWSEVMASQACMFNSKNQISFCLEKTDSTVMFRGWERTRRRFSWAGLNYSVNPNCKIFNYSVSLRFHL